MERRQVLRALGFATSFGATAALLTVAGALGGRWLDRRVHTAPAFTIIGLFLGLGAGMVVFVREVARILGGPPSR